MKNFIRWFAGFFEDQQGSASSKRLTLYAMVYFFYMQVKASIDIKVKDLTLDHYIFYGTLLMLLFLVGAITSEFFKNKIEQITAINDSSKTTATQITNIETK